MKMYSFLKFETNAEQILLISNNDVTVSMIDTLGTGKDTKVSTTDTTTSTSTSSSGSY